MERYASMFASSRHSSFFSCMPTTFNLPKQYSAFEAAFAGADKAQPLPSVQVRVLVARSVHSKGS